MIQIICPEHGVFEQKAYNAEQKILNDYEKHRVFTKLSTELFKFDILKYYSLDLKSVI